MVFVNNFKMAASGVSLVARKTQNWGFVETKTLIGLWAEEDIQRQLASMGRKKNIWEGIAMKLQESGYSRSGDQWKTFTWGTYLFRLILHTK